MITITNQKIAGFSPRWADFRGFSILFDNPGDCLTPTEKRLDLACDVAGDPQLDFYRALRNTLQSLDIDLLTNSYLFCPLPPPSYHVTLWDGANSGNIGKVNMEQRAHVASFLTALPDSVLHPNALTEMAAASPLVTTEDWNIRFRFDQLIKWGNSVIVARLAPAEADSAQRLAELTHERSQLSARFRQAFGISPSEEYRPHVSLGYFANREAAQLTTGCIDDWNQMFAEQMQGLTLDLHTASVYGFTDMATFFKAHG